MFVTGIRNSLNNSIHSVKSELTRAFNSKAVTAARAVVEGSSIGYKAITLAAGAGLLATTSPFAVPIVVTATALAAFVAVNDYRKLLRHQQPMLGHDVQNIEADADRALKAARAAKEIPRILLSLPDFA